MAIKSTLAGAARDLSATTSGADMTVDRPDKRPIALGAVSLAVLSTVFSALYWNRFLAPSGGYTFFYLAEQMLRGRLPYRDIFFVVPPLEAFKLEALIRLFGDKILIARTEAAIERTILALLLYYLLTRFCRAGSALLASFLTIVILSADPADAIVNYHIDSAFWAVAAVTCAVVWIRGSGPSAKAVAVVLSGVFAALSILTKQTTGAGIIAALAITGSLIAGRSNGIRGTGRFLSLLLIGWLAPVAAFTAWLAGTGSLKPFLRTIFTSSTSKGTILAVLARPATQFPWLFLFAAAMVPVLALIVRRTPKSIQPESTAAIVTLTAACSVAVVLVVASVYSGAWWPGSLPLVGGHRNAGVPKALLIATSLRVILEDIILMMTIPGSAFLFLTYFWRWLKGALSPREEQIWLLSAASFAVAYMLSLSWAVYSPMAAPGVALISGLALDRLAGGAKTRFWALASVILLVAYGSMGGKLMQPFNWMLWGEPAVADARSASSLPKLAGLRVSEPTLSLTENITKLIQENTRSGDTLLVYPYFPIFYVLTGLNPPTYAFNHYIDVCPDSVCRQDAATLRIHPPDAIVYMRETSGDLQRDEGIFRSGGTSGSREVAETIEAIASGYRKLLSTVVPGSGRTIEVYTKQ